ncbi:MAG: ester cyclase [Verrucomicrobiota bacterium]
MAANPEWTNREATEYWIEKVWNQQDENTITELMAEDCNLKGLDIPANGREGFQAFHRAITTSFDDVKVEILEIGVDGDLVFGHCQFTGNHRASGKDVVTHFSMSGKWKDGLLVEGRNVVDFTQMLTQVGELAPDAMARVFA